MSAFDAGAGSAPYRQETPASAGDAVLLVSDASSPLGVTPDRASGLGAHP
jgi:hypothetical protein